MKTRRFFSILLVVAFSVSTWALDKDADGYYLIGSVQDWKDFAALVNNGTEPTAKARMVADINLGDDQTRIGDTREVEDGYFFEGVFDGQGHTLTIAYDVTDNQTTSDPQAPFTHIKGATIKNLHVDGTVATSHAHSAIVAWVRGGTNVISNVWSSLKTTTSKSGWDECSAIVSWIGHATVTIQDCLFTGSITGTNGTSYNGCFIGWCQHGDDNTQVLNCLSTGTFTNIGNCDPTRGRTHTNSYIKQFPTSIPVDMQVTDDNLANGTTTAALNSNRTGDDAPWIQDPVTHQPMLKMFASLKQDSEGYYLIGSVKDWDNFAALVEITSAANAKMTADINLGDDQTMIGSGTDNERYGGNNTVYKGVFDGNGHTLTINYVSNEAFIAPIRHIYGATIKNLHVKGSIVGGNSGLGGIVASIVGTGTWSYIQNCYSSVSIECTNSSNTGNHIGGIVAQHGWESNLSMTDCLFDGSLKRESSDKFMSGFVGCYDGVLNVTNCLQIGTMSDTSNSTNKAGTFSYHWTHGSLTPTNSYYPNLFGEAQGTQVTNAQLADGTIASKLGSAWVQDGSTPMLKIFASNNSGISTGEAIQVHSSKFIVQSESWYSISGQKLSGKPTAKGIYIRNGRKIIIK